MASIRKQGASYEIRECRSTDRGPRQYTLARFSGVLTPEVIEAAAARAHRPLDPAQLIAAARRRGIAVSPHRSHSLARRLIAELRGGLVLEPSLVSLLKRSLVLMEDRAVPEHLADAADWVGRSEADRGRALRGLLRTASRVTRSREPRRALPEAPFPRFSSLESAARAS